MWDVRAFPGVERCERASGDNQEREGPEPSLPAKRSLAALPLRPQGESVRIVVIAGSEDPTGILLEKFIVGELELR